MFAFFFPALAFCSSPVCDVGVQQRKYQFAQNLERYVGKNVGEHLLIGQLDANGTFDLVLVRERNAMMRLPAFHLMNSSIVVDTYEFRSGRLIKGRFAKDGHFVPESGSKVTEFADYVYGPDSIPIYNLPGYFVEVRAVAPKDK
jgi:hypothetical protein